MIVYFLYILAPLILVLMVLVAVRLFRYRNVTGSKTFLVLVCLSAWWLIFAALELHTPIHAQKIILARIAFPAIAFIPVAWFLFSMLYASHWQKINRVWMTLLSIIPLISTVLSATNGSHHLLLKEITFTTYQQLEIMHVQFNTYFWIHSAYSYLLIVIGMIVILTAKKHPSRLYRRQSLIVVLGVAIPLICNVFYVYFSNPLASVDITPFSFVAAILLVGWGVFRWDLFGRYPVARDSAFEGMRDGFILLDYEGYIIDSNPAANVIFGRNVKELINYPFDKLLPGVLSVKGNEKPFEREIEALIRNIWHGIRLFPLWDHNEKLRGFALFIRDIHQEHQTQMALGESEEKFRSLVEQSSDGIILVDDHLRIVTWNPAMVAFTEIPEEEAVGKWAPEIIEMIMPPDMRGQFALNVAEYFSNSENLDTPYQHHATALEYFIWSRSEKISTVTISFFQVLFGGKKGRGAILRDFSELKRQKDQLYTARHMAGLGTLAAGAAHEINSPLQVVCGISDRLLRTKDNSPDKAPTREELTMLNRNAWRVAEIVHSLLRYAEAVPGEFAPHDLNQIVHETALLFKSQFENQPFLSLKLDMAPDLPEIIIDRGLIGEALVQLVKNALGSIVGGGVVTIRTRYQAETPIDASRFLLEVADNGVGIPDDILARVFDPFFSTHDYGDGKGMGLSVVAGIVRAHGGEINIKSKLGKGTQVMVELPPVPPEHNKGQLFGGSSGRFN